MTPGIILGLLLIAFGWLVEDGWPFILLGVVLLAALGLVSLGDLLVYPG